MCVGESGGGGGGVRRGSESSYQVAVLKPGLSLETQIENSIIIVYVSEPSS